MVERNILTKRQYKEQYDVVMNNVTYTIDQVCETTGVSRRTVRYYVQEGLLEPPVGRGRGGNYLASHVERLREIRSLQEKGWTLSSIEKYLKERGRSTFPRILEDRVHTPEKGDREENTPVEEVIPVEGRTASVLFPGSTPGASRTVRTTFRIAPGVEIVVDRDAEEGMSRKIQEIIRVATTILSRKE